MFIAIDIGNTNITIGIYENQKWQEYRIGSEELQPLTYYTHQLSSIARDLDLTTLEGVAVSSVVPHLTEVIMDATKIELHKDPLLIQKKWYHLLPVSTPNPEEMGSDLLANALAGYDKQNKACLIVDFGTALTYTLVNNSGDIVGVAIAPGIRTALQALAGNAAQLPEISLELPDKPLGTNTAEAMSSGILWGFVGQVNFMVKKITDSVDYPVLKVATGGLSHVLQPLEETFDEIDKNLTVKGIYKFFTLVQESRA